MTNRPFIGIGVLVVNNDRILLGKRKNAHGTASWGPPGGHLEFGETFEVCAIRETLEETGLKIETPSFLAVTNDFFIEDNRHYVSIFVTSIYTGDQTLINKEPHKFEKWEWFDLNNLPNPLFLPLKNLLTKQGYCTNTIIRDLIESYK